MRAITGGEPVPVLHLSAPLTIAGAERVILTYADVHDRKRYRLHIASFINEQRIADNPFPAEVRTRQVDSRVISVCRSIDMRDVGKVASVIRETGARILHTHGYRSDVIGLLAARLCRIRIVSTVHGWTPVNSRVSRYEQVDRLALRFFDRVIAVSEAIRRGLVESGVAGNKVLTLNNAVAAVGNGLPDADTRERMRREIGVAPEEILVGVIGRLSAEKGVNYFLESLALARRTLPGMKALIVGDGPDADELKAQAGELGLRESVIFAGFRKEIAPFYAAIDCIALPSLTEGIPMVVLEAFAHGQPVVATRVGGVPEIITDGSDGLLVESRCPGEMADRLLLLAADAGMRRELAAGGRATLLNRFNPEIWAGSIENIYRELLR